MSWADLNKRQQHYLQAVYEVDQAQEANVKWLGSQGRWNNTPASEWRWMSYNASGAALLRKIQDAGYRDEGTGSTFAALERRGLVLCKYEPATLGGPILFVQITRAGRKMVRSKNGTGAPSAVPTFAASRACPMIAIRATASGMSAGIPACDYATTGSKGRSAASPTRHSCKGYTTQHEKGLFQKRCATSYPPGEIDERLR
jgi:hypothetical protein